MASSEACSLSPTVNLVSPHRVPLLLGISLSSSGLDLAPICEFVADRTCRRRMRGFGQSLGWWVWDSVAGVWGSVSAWLVDLQNGMFQIWCGWWWLPLCEMVRIFFFQVVQLLSIYENFLILGFCFYFLIFSYFAKAGIFLLFLKLLVRWCLQTKAYR